jgi:hypothetical protein
MLRVWEVPGSIWVLRLHILFTGFHGVMLAKQVDPGIIP